MRDYTRFDQYLDRLAEDIYGQPAAESHTAWANQAIELLLPKNTKAVLDVGCGQGFLAEPFLKREIHWTGVTLGPDVTFCINAGVNVKDADMSFLPFEDGSFDLIFARHALEHSPFPILTLMEWARVSSKHLLLIAPAPDYWTSRGKNHYSVAPKDQLVWWLNRAGWLVKERETFMNSDPRFLHYWRRDMIKAKHFSEEAAPLHFPKDDLVVEYRFLCSKGEETVA